MASPMPPAMDPSLIQSLFFDEYYPDVAEADDWDDHGSLDRLPSQVTKDEDWKELWRSVTGKCRTWIQEWLEDKEAGDPTEITLETDDLAPMAKPYVHLVLDWFRRVNDRHEEERKGDEPGLNPHDWWIAARRVAFKDAKRYPCPPPSIYTQHSTCTHIQRSY